MDYYVVVIIYNTDERSTYIFTEYKIANKLYKMITVQQKSMFKCDLDTGYCKEVLKNWKEKI